MKDGGAAGGAVRGASRRTRRRTRTCWRGPSSTPPARSTRPARSAPRAAGASASARSLRHIFYGIPDVLGDRARAATPAVACWWSGSGHSALNALLDLAHAGRRGPGHADRLGHPTPVARPAARGRATGPARGTRQARLARRRAARRAAGSSSSPASASTASRSTADGIVVQRRRALAGAGRRDHRRHRLPARLVDPVRSAARSRSGGRESARAGAADRSQRPQLRHGAAARRRRTEAPGRQPVRRSA